MQTRPDLPTSTSSSEPSSLQSSTSQIANLNSKLSDSLPFYPQPSTVLIHRHMKKHRKVKRILGDDKMKTSESTACALPKALQELITKETPNLVEYLSHTAKNYNHIGEVFKVKQFNGRLYFRGSETESVLHNFLNDKDLLSAFKTAYDQFQMTLSFENVKYCREKIIDYFLSFISEQESWKQFFESQSENIKKSGKDIVRIQKKVQGSFIYALALTYNRTCPDLTVTTAQSEVHQLEAALKLATGKLVEAAQLEAALKLATGKLVGALKLMTDKLFVFSRITNALHLQDSQKIINRHEKKMTADFFSYVRNLSHLFLTRRKKIRGEYLAQLEVAVDRNMKDINYSCLENAEQIIIDGLKLFYHSIPEKRAGCRKEAAATISRIMAHFESQSKELLLAKPNKLLKQTSAPVIPVGAYAQEMEHKRIITAPGVARDNSEGALEKIEDDEKDGGEKEKNNPSPTFKLKKMLSSTTIDNEKEKNHSKKQKNNLLPFFHLRMPSSATQKEDESSVREKPEKIASWQPFSPKIKIDRTNLMSANHREALLSKNQNESDAVDVNEKANERNENEKTAVKKASLGPSFS